MHHKYIYILPFMIIDVHIGDEWQVETRTSSQENTSSEKQ